MIVKHELIKIVKTPIIVVLIVFFLVLNLFIVLSHSDSREELAVLSELVDHYGYKIDQEMLTELGSDF